MLSLILWGLLSLIPVAIAYFFYSLYKDAKYFKDQGIVYVGNGLVRITIAMFNKVTFPQTVLDSYQEIKSKKARFGGAMEFGQPSHIITDLDLAKLVLVKDFDHFVNRRTNIVTENNMVFLKTLFAMEGEKWKSLRVKMTPTFTTGKIRRMFLILDESSKKMVKYLKSETSKSGDGVIDLKVSYAKYTMDVIASVAFGLDSKAFEQTGDSHFETMGNKMQFKLDIRVIVEAMVMLFCPRVADALGFAFLDPVATNFFSGVIKSAIKYRQENKDKRDDFLQLMLEARAGQLKSDDGGELSQFEKEAVMVNKDDEKVTVDLEDDDIVAQSVLFILGGYDTTQSALMFSAYHLAVYPDLQERLFQEVRKSAEENDGELTYDSINKMEYMEMFISETLRCYPPFVTTDRTCTKAYKIPDSDVTVQKGSLMSIPIFGIHRDPEHYPEPDRFDPERFSVENRPKIHPCAYIPFGYGPRNCIAMRFALMETKLAVAHLVLNFMVEPSEKTLIPMKFASTSNLKPEGGMPLKLKARK